LKKNIPPDLVEAVWDVEWTQTATQRGIYCGDVGIGVT